MLIPRRGWGRQEAPPVPIWVNALATPLRLNSRAQASTGPQGLQMPTVALDLPGQPPAWASSPTQPPSAETAKTW